MTANNQAKALAERCSDAYSADRYNSWPAVAAVLLKSGLSERQAEAVMRSKWTRWAADGTDARYGRVPARAIIAYIDRYETADSIKRLTVGTFGREAT